MVPNGHSSPDSKAKRANDVTEEGLRSLTLMLESMKAGNASPENIEKALAEIDRIRTRIRLINEEKPSSLAASVHHPGRQYVCGPNGFVLFFCRHCHDGVEKFISRAERMMLVPRIRVYADINELFIKRRGGNITDEEIAGIVLKTENNIRKLSPRDLRERMMEKGGKTIGRLREMLKSKGVI